MVERRTEERFLLYIDILNFSNLVAREGKVEEVYEIINRLNVHRHDVFTTIIFSDTILVYNKSNARALEDVRYMVMFLCEFAQDLFYRLIGKDVHFRAYITCADFAHYPMENIKDVFYGEALIEAYRAEKSIQAMGLFMSNLVAPYSDIFKTARFNRNCRFVYIMRTLERHSARKQDYPLDPHNLMETDAIWLLAYDIRYLEAIHRHKNDAALPARVRKKYESTWRLLMRRHRGFMTILEESGFDPRAISACDWTEPFARIGTRRGFFG
ncbi:MAG: hypothetical protein J0H49_13945 [Acidobacteria bacterium]|nr:hypothetical protein [Acidobacteriota bacterium]